MTELYLDQNQLVGTLPSISRLTNLKELSLASNKLNGRIPNDWGDVRQLEILRLDTTRVSGTIPEFIGNMTSLSKYVNCCTIHDSMCTWHLIAFSPPDCKETLTIEGSLLSGSIPTTVGYLTELGKQLQDKVTIFSTMLTTNLIARISNAHYKPRESRWDHPIRTRRLHATGGIDSGKQFSRRKPPNGTRKSLDAQATRC